MDPIKTSSPLRILLVEDNEHDRLAFGRAFKKSEVSCEITECIRAEEALERLRADASSFDVVVIDHGLPGMSGLDLCKELLDEEIRLPLVILTGTGSEQLAVEALKAGVHDYMIKDPSQGYLNLLPVVLPEVVRKHGDRVARKRAEEALRESEERFRKIIEGSEAGYFFVDRNGRFRDTNEAWLRMHGYSSRDEVIGQHFALTQVDEHMEQAQRQFESLLSGEAIPSGESRRRFKDGSIGYHTFSANPVVKGGKIVGVEAFLIDITERKQAEEALRESEDRAYRDQRRMEILKFANDVALKLMHELRNPLTAIGGYSRRMSSRDYPEDKLKEYTKIIFEQSMRLDNVLNEVLVHLKTAAEQV